MAKQMKTTIEIDVVAKGIDLADKAIANIDSSQGELYKKAQKVSKAIEKIRDITKTYGDNIPIAKAKELAKYMQVISEETADMADMDEVVIFNKKELENLKKISNEIEEIQAKLNAVKKAKKSLAGNMEQERINELKTQKTARNSSKQDVSLDPLRRPDGTAKFNSKEDLETLSKDSDPKVAKAAAAALHQLSVTADKAKKKIGELDQEYAKLTQQLQEANEKYNDLSSSTRILTEEEKANYDTVSKFAQEQTKSIEQVTEASQKQGEEYVKTSKALDKQQTSLKGAVKQLFSWTAVLNIGKRMLSEAVRTVKEMDKALTGMAVVTHMTREETAELIPQIQKLAKETSTAMTEIANLVTEYTKQGRSLKESFILAEETAKAAKIAGISAAESIQYMTSAINGFNLAAKDATRVSDIFANLAAASATDYEQLAIALSKVSAQANLAGLSIEYTTALLAKGIETTQEAPESIGTALKTILARMRELSDYGKTLEDGASVNKVENALSAAGIKLRNLNGEFRELEDIFNELGPKWDNLNTMQQQAIAQAVAGTRQQSRFVAIMQDWERTQELAAEAQDSAGASAAQYAEQAKGMEAAMTNLTTAWQSFIQSLTDSEFLIGTVRFLTKVLDGLTKILSSGGDFTKNLVIGLVSVTALIKGLQTIGKVRESISSWIKNNTEDEAEAAEKVADEKKRSLEYEKTMLELRLKANKKALNDSYEQEEELNSSDSIDGDAYNNLYAEQTRLLEEQKMLKEQIASIDASIAETTNGTVQLEYNLKQQIQMLDAEAQANALTKLDSQIAANEALQLQLEMEEAILQKEKEITDEKIKQLQAELMDTDDSDLERQAELKAQINKLEADQEGRNKSIAKLVTKRGKLEKANLKLDQKRSKIVNGETKSYKKTLSIVKTLANKVLKKFGVDTSKIEKGWSGIKTLFGKVKDTGDQNNVSLSKLLDGQKQSVKNYDDMLKSGQLIVNGEKQRALTEDEIVNITERKRHAEESIQNIQAAQKDLGEQGLVTQKQAGQLLNMEQATQEAVLVVQEGQSAAEGAETAAQTAGLPSEVAEAGANISAAASQPYGSGIPLAIMGVAALAAVGLAGGLAGIISANSGSKSGRDQKMESKIADSQNLMYEAKKQNKEISASKDRYIELSSKTDLSIEEQEELQELTESIQDMDESFANKTGPDLIDAMNDLTRKNENIINKEIEASYQNALKMDNLAASELGRQAVENKIIKSQEELIKSNSALAMANKAVVDSVTEKTAAMADSFADNMSEEKFGTANGYGWDDFGSFYLENVGLAMASSLIPVVGPILTLGHTINEVGEIFKQTQEKSDQIKERNQYIAQFSQASVQFATEMETYLAEQDAQGNSAHTLGEQIEQYSKNLEMFAVDDYMKDVFAEQYKTLDFMSSFINDNNGLDLNYKNQILSNIDKLTELGHLTTSDIEKLVAVFANLSDKEERYKEGNELLETYDLVDVATKFGLDGTANAKLLADTMMQTVNIDKDGNYSRNWDNSNDENSYKFGSAGLTWWEDEVLGQGVDYGYTDEYLTNVVDKILPKLEEAGLGEASFNEIQEYIDLITKHKSPEMLFADFVDKTVEAFDGGADKVTALYNTERNSELQLRIDSLKETANKNKKLMEEARGNNDIEAFNAAKSAYDAANKEATELKNQMHTVIQELSGYKTSKDLNEFVDKVNSSVERVKELKESGYEQTAFDTEKLEMLENDIIPTLQEAYGDAFDPSAFLKNLQEGTAEGIEWMERYEQVAAENTLTALTDNVNSHKEEIKNLEEEYLNAAEDEKEAAKAKLDAEKAALAVAEIQLDNYEKQLEVKKGMTKEERKRHNLQSKISILEDKEDLESLKTLQKLLEELNIEKIDELNDAYEDLHKKLGSNTKLTVDQLKNIVKVENGVVLLSDGYEKLTDKEKEYIKESLEDFKELADGLKEVEDQLEDTFNSRYETQIESQSQLIEAYRSQLEEEQEALQNSLDKRREMYEKYFDSLDNEVEDENFEEEQARLQRAISALSSSTDATSLEKLKEYQETLKELEEDHLQTERDRRRDATMESFDNQSESIDQYYEDRMDNEQQLWADIRAMSEVEIQSLMTTYNEEYKNATELNKQYMLLSYKELHADVMSMMGNTDAATKARAEYENYKKYLEAYLENPSIGKYDSAKKYSTGGLVDYTGLAMVHGSTSKPEAFLNASQTAIFTQLAQGLENYFNKPSSITADNNKNSESSVTIENLTIAVDATLTDNNVQQTGESLAEALLNGLRRTGVSVNMKK